MPDFVPQFSLDDVRPGWETGVAVVLGDLVVQGSPLAHDWGLAHYLPFM